MSAPDRKDVSEDLTGPPNKPNKGRVAVLYISFCVYVAGLAAFIPSAVSLVVPQLRGKAGEDWVLETIGEQVPPIMVFLCPAIAAVAYIVLRRQIDQAAFKDAFTKDLGTKLLVGFLVLFLPSIILFLPPILALGISAAVAAAFYLHTFLNDGKSATPPTKEASARGDSV